MMRDNMPTFALLCFLLWMLPADSTAIRRSILMGMVKDAVDDMYEGCTAKMMAAVKKTYMKKESQKFLKAWKKEETCAKKGLKKKGQEDTALTKEHMQAICVYTAKNVYQEFNKAVQTSKANYSTQSFQYYSLHFLLTDAIRILKTGQESCRTTYRRTKDDFSGNVDQIIRLGNFASSSLKPDLKKYGKKTCFEIRTCLGAYLKKYSKDEDKEQEVLIPPYEKFMIIKKGPGLSNTKGLGDCEIVYSLESVGVQSNLNCKAADI